MFFFEPRYYHRDCEVCKKWVLDDNGRPQKDVSGALITQSENHSCRDCPKENFKDGWEYGNERLFEMYILGRAFGKLPRAGGLADQPPELVELFYYLWQVEKAAERMEGKVNFEGVMTILGLARRGR